MLIHDVSQIIEEHAPRSSGIPGDELGLLVMSEIPLWQWKGNVEGEENCRRKLESAKRQVRSMIQRDFNHPSIIVWSVSNETLEQNAEVADGNRQLIRLVHELDRSRLATHVSDHWGSWTTADFTEDDLICCNWYPSLKSLIAVDAWGFTGRSSTRPDRFDYSLGAAAWRRELEAFHQKHAGRPILITPCASSSESISASEPFTSQYRASSNWVFLRQTHLRFGNMYR